MSACPTRTTSGKFCRSPVVKGKHHCFFHDPDSAEKRATAQANGGAERGKRVPPTKTLGKRAPVVDVSGEEPVRALVKETIEQVRRGDIAPGVGQVIGQLLAVALKALKQDETERKLKELDDRTKPLAGLTVAQLEAIIRGGQGAPTAEADPAAH